MPRPDGLNYGMRSGDEHSGAWDSMTVDEAVEHLKSWIDGIDEPNENARLMLVVCGCSRAAVVEDGKRIMFELPRAGRGTTRREPLG